MDDLAQVKRTRDEAPSPSTGEGWGEGDAPGNRPLTVALSRKGRGYE